MDELNQDRSAKRKRTTGVRRSMKKSTRVDLTSMVDLGFLLITFFIFTTSLSRPNALAIKLPKDVPDKEREKIPVSGALTLLPNENNRVYYYEKDNYQAMQLTDYSGVRSVIMAKKTSTKPGDFMVIIKPGPDATYKNTIQLLDEITINEVKRYVLVDIDVNKYEWIKGINK